MKENPCGRDLLLAIEIRRVEDLEVAERTVVSPFIVNKSAPSTLIKKRCCGEPLGFQRLIQYCENVPVSRLNPFSVYQIDRLSVNEFIGIKKGFCS